MAQAGFTPISLYFSSTAAAVPTSGNLANGELALNIADMKLYAKNSAGAVTLLASSGGASGTVSSVAVSGGTTGLTTSGGPITTSGTITLAGTLGTANGGTNLTSFTSGGVVYASSTSALATGSGLTFDGTGNLTCTGTVTGNSFTAYSNSADGGTQGYVGNAKALFGGSPPTSSLGVRGETNILFGISSTEAMRLTSTSLYTASGINVGIGTTSPSSKLDVRGSQPIIRVEDNAGTGAATFQAFNDGKISYFGRENSAGNYFFASTVTPYSTVLNAYNSTAPIIFGHSQPEVFILNGGNVGIGTSSPSSYASKTLQVNGSSTDVTIKLTNTTTGTGNASGFDFEMSGSDINYVNRTASGVQKFWTNSTERARIDASGDLLVGTSSSAGRVTVNGATADSSANSVSFRNSSSTSLFVVRNDGRIATGGAASPYNNTSADAANVYVDASGIFYRSTAAGGAAGLVQVATQTVTGGVTAVNLDGISGTYTNYLLMIEGAYTFDGPSPNLSLRMRCSGSTDSNSAYAFQYNQSTGTWSGGSSSPDTSIGLTVLFPNGFNPATSYFGYVYISTFLNASGTSYVIRFNSYVTNPTSSLGAVYPNITAGTYRGTAGLNSTVTGVALRLAGLNMYGKYTLYGLT